MWVVPVGCLLPIVTIGGCLTAVFVFVFGMLKSSDAYTHSLAAVRADSELQAALGEPIEPGYFVTGNINVSGSAGHADLFYDVTGPKGTGTVYVVADKQAGQWTFETLVVEIGSSGQRIDVLVNKEAEAAADESI